MKSTGYQQVLRRMYGYDSDPIFYTVLYPAASVSSHCEGRFIRYTVEDERKHDDVMCPWDPVADDE